MKKLAPATFLLAIAVLAFIAGGLVVLNQAFPYHFLHDANLAGHSLFEAKTRYSDPYHTDLWRKARTKKKGVVVYDSAKADNGYTLYSSSDAQKVMLMDMQGHVVHEWHMKYRSFWDKSAGIKPPRSASNIFITRAYMYPDGDLLALYIGIGNTPWGAGLVKMDKNSHLIWKYMAHTHHDMDVDPDGKVYVLTQGIVHKPIKRFTQLEPPWIEDYVSILSPQGKLLKKIALTPALLHSIYGRLFANLPWFSVTGAGDFLHTNSIQFITPRLAAHFPYAKAGDILISFREMNTIAVLDPVQRKIVWALHGPWIGQHCPRLLTDGNILVFDNNGHFGPGGRSQVIEFAPETFATVWQYAGNKQRFFQSKIRGGEQRLPNGNTLITEEQAGILLEVTPRDKIVWKFVNSVRGGKEKQYIPVVSVATRFKPSWFDPEFLAQIRQRQREEKKQ